MLFPCKFGGIKPAPSIEKIGTTEARSSTQNGWINTPSNYCTNFDLSSRAGYQTFTADDFVIRSIPNKTYGKSPRDHSSAASNGGFVFYKNYNSTTGILTIGAAANLGVDNANPRDQSDSLVFDVYILK